MTIHRAYDLLYSYALNNPLRMIDPSGLTACFYGGAGDTPQNDTDTTDYESTMTEQECSDNGGTSLDVNANVNVNGNGSGSDLITLDGGGSSTLIDQGTVAQGTVAPSKTACNIQRATSGVMGAANLGLAVGKGFALGGAVAGLGATGVGAPTAAVLAVYGTVSIFGQGLTGAAQLYSAATGNYGTAGKVAQIGNILSGPVSGLGTLLGGGSLASAERNAGYESAFTAGAGLIDAIRAGGAALPLAMADHSTAQMGLFGTGGGNACATGH